MPYDDDDKIPAYQRKLSPVERHNERRFDWRPLWGEARRGVMHLWLLPIQLYAVAVLASLLIVLIGVFLPGVLPQLLGDTHGTLENLSRTQQILLLAPVSALLLRWPWAAAICLGPIYLLVRWDISALQERRAARKHRMYAPKLQLLGDNPLTENERDERSHRHSRTGPRDALGYHAFAGVIAKLILESARQAPFVLSIEAKWGMGKTTIMRMLESLLDEQVFPDKPGAGMKTWKCYTVYFNAWKYKGSDVRKGLEQIYKRVNRQATVEVSPDRACSLAACPTFLTFAVMSAMFGKMPRGAAWYFG